MLPLLIALSSLALADDAPGARADAGAPRLASEDVRSEGQIIAWGLLQGRITVMDQDVHPQADPATYGDPEDDPGFGLIRTRLGLDGTLPLGDLGDHHQVRWTLSFGANAPYDVLSPAHTNLQVVDAFLSWTADTPIGPGGVTVGRMRVPFNRGDLIRSADLLFQERDVGSAWISPGRDVGAVGAQALELGDDGPQVLLRAGLFNGGGTLFGDTDPGLLAAGRLELVLGDAYRTWSPDLDNALGIGVAALRNSELSLGETALAADLLARFKVVTLTGEFLTSTLEPTNSVVTAPGVLAETTRRAFSAQLSVWIPLEDENGLEVGARFSLFDDATHREDMGDVRVLHAGLTWRNPFPHIDLGAGYVMRMEPHGEFKNDSVRLWVQGRPRFVLN